MTRVIQRRATALFATVVLCTLAFGQITLTDHTYGSPNGPSDVFVADLNGDGKPDIVTTQDNSNMVTVFLNHGDGTFTDQGSAQYLAGQNPLNVVVADINGDGIPDIVTAGGNCFQGGPSVVNLLLGNGDGTFQAPQETQLGSEECVDSLALTKVNSTKWDLAVGTELNTIRLLMNNGAGPFTLGASIPSPGLNVFGVSSADYNRDGHFDLAFISFTPDGQQSVNLFLNDGAGHYTHKELFTISAVTGSATGFNFSAATTVDVNGDGIADLLIPFAPAANQNNPPIQGGVVVAINNGTGGFTTTTLRINSRFFGVAGKAAEGDLNGDGLHDIVLGAQSDATLGQDAFVVFRATSKTTWASAQYFNAGTNVGPSGVAMGAFNGHEGFAGSTVFGNTLHVFNPGGGTAGCSAPTSAGVHVCSPANGATVTSPVAISAAANGGTKPITAMKAYIDGKQVAFTSSGSLSASVATAAGTHVLNVNAWNSAGTVFTSQTTFTVH